MTFIVIILCVAAMLAMIVASKPNDFRVTRSLDMAAPPETAFAQVNDFHKWEAWSPWAKLDPAVKKAYDGNPAGRGAIFRWDGNNKVGKGDMTILESRPSDFIQIRLEFMKPFKAVHTAEFTFQPNGDKTTVTWSTYGTNTFVGKAITLAMNCDKMLGNQFEKGLWQMKSICEAK